MVFLPVDIVCTILEFSGHVRRRRDRAAGQQPWQWQLPQHRVHALRLMAQPRIFVHQTGLSHVSLILVRYTWHQFMHLLDPHTQLWANIIIRMKASLYKSEGRYVHLVYQRFAFAPHCAVVFYSSDVNAVLWRPVTLWRNDAMPSTELTVRQIMATENALLEEPTSRQLDLVRQARVGLICTTHFQNDGRRDCFAW